MPPALRRPCAETGCPELVVTGRCATHERQHDRQRGTAHARGYTSRWTRYSQYFRRRYPLCGMRPPGAPETTHSRCQQEGRVSPSQQVDHIVPVRGKDDPRFWERTNHQALCNACHSAKTAIENGGFGR